MSSGKKNYSNTCSVCEDSFESFGEYLGHFKSDHDKPPWRDKEVLVELYVDMGLTQSETADKLGCGPTTITKWLKKNDIDARTISEARSGVKFGDYGVTTEQKKKLNDKRWVVKNYVERGRSMANIAEELGCSKEPVKNALEYFNVDIRDPNWEGYVAKPGKLSDYPELYDGDWMETEYIEKDRKLIDIAEELGCSIFPVSQAVQRFDIQKDMSEVNGGENHPMYKGGRVKYGAMWYRSRRERLKHDGHECVGCGMSDQAHTEKYGRSLNVHHIRPVRSFENHNDAHRLSNLVTFCISCHHRWEGIPLRPQPNN